MVTSVELLGPGGSPRAPETGPQVPETLPKGPSKAPQQSPGGPPAAYLSAHQAVVWGSWGGLGGSWAALGRSWRFLAGFWPLPAPLGPLRGRPGWPWPPPWADSDGSWAAPGQVSAPPDRSWRHRTLVWPTDRNSSTVQRFRWFLRDPQCLRGGSWRAFGDPRSPLGRSGGAPSLSGVGRDCPGRRWEPLRRPGGAFQERTAPVWATVRTKTSVSGPSHLTGPRGNQVKSSQNVV